MKLTEKQKNIIAFIRENGRVSSEEISDILKIERDELNQDLNSLCALEIIGRNPSYGYYYLGEKNYISFIETLKMYEVENIMSLPAIVEETVSVYDAIVTLFLSNVGSIYITSGGLLAGVVSRKDLLRASIGDMDLFYTPVNIVMTRMPNLKWVYRDTSVYECAKIIVKSQIDGVPVVEALNESKKEFRVVGRVTKTNITNLLVNFGRDYSIEGLL